MSLKINRTAKTTTSEDANVTVSKTRFQDFPEGWLSLIFLLIAYMTVVWSIQGAGWVRGSEILSYAGLLGFLVGFGLARLKFVWGILAHTFMLSVGMVTVSILTFGYGDARYTDWMSKLGNTVNRVIRWVEGAFTGRAQEDKLVILVGLGIVVWLVGYSTAWLVFRRHWVWSAITVMGAAFIINLSYSPPNAKLAFAIWVLASLLVVVRINYFKNEQRWQQLRFFFKPGIVTNTLLLTAILTPLIIGVAFIAPSSNQSPQVQALLDQITTPFDSVREGLFGSSSGGKDSRIARSSAGFQSFGKSFTIGGPLNLSDAPVLRVRGDDPTYLQAAVLDAYDGKGWLATYQDAPIQNDIVFPQLSLAANQMLPTSPDKGRITNQLQITMLQNNVSTLFMGGDPVSIDRQSLLAFHWEPVVIKTALDDIQVRGVGVGQDGKPRNLLVDTTNKSKPISPDLLPLVRLLKQAQTEADTQAPPPLTANYLRPAGGAWRVEFDPKQFPAGTPKLTSNADGTFTLEYTSWIIKFPAPSSLDQLSRQPGANFEYSNKTNPRTLYYGRIEAIKKVNENQYTFSTKAINNKDRKTFEASSLGKEIQVEVSRLIKQIPNIPAKVDYTFENGRPLALNYEGYQPNYDDLLVVSAAQTPKSGESYATNGMRYRSDAQNLRSADTNYPDWVRARYLQIPNTVPSRVRDFAKQTADNGLIVYDISNGAISATAPNSSRNAYDKAKAIETYLRTLKYNDRVGFIPDGRDAVDYFLFDSKEGYCVHFASAMVVMLRSQGIPARVATGLIGGQFDPETASTVIKGTASHAWVQAYFPGYGWVNFEPTPAYGAPQPPNPASLPIIPTPTPGVAGAVPENPTPATENPSNPVETPANPNTPAVSGRTEDSGWAVWLAILLGLTGAVVIAWQANLAWVRSQLALADTSSQSVYQRLNKAAKQAKLNARQEMTPFEYAGYLAHKLSGTDSSVRQLTTNYVRDRYGPPFTEAEQPQPEAVREQWQTVMSGIIKYRRYRRIKQLTPKFMHKWLKLDEENEKGAV